MCIHNEGFFTCTPRLVFTHLWKRVLDQDNLRGLLYILRNCASDNLCVGNLYQRACHSHSWLLDTLSCPRILMWFKWLQIPFFLIFSFTYLFAFFFLSLIDNKDICMIEVFFIVKFHCIVSGSKNWATTNLELLCWKDYLLTDGICSLKMWHYNSSPFLFGDSLAKIVVYCNWICLLSG